MGLEANGSYLGFLSPFYVLRKGLATFCCYRLLVLDSAGRVKSIQEVYDSRAGQA